MTFLGFYEEGETGMKVAILTRASSGIGYEVAKEFAEEGYTLILGSRQPGEAVRKLNKLGATIVGLQETWRKNIRLNN